MKTIPPPCPHPETGPKYWRSLEEVAETPAFRQWLEQEFPAGASEFSDPVSRRNFVKIMASSFAFAGLGLTGCRRPVENIVPFNRMPADYIHGVPQYYATSMPTRTGSLPLLVKAHEGRPIKIEGNAEHPDSNGGTNTWAQASILNLYDVDRAKRYIRGGNAVTRENALQYLSQLSRKFQANGGAGLVFLLEPASSPSRDRLQDAMAAKFPQARWFVYDPLDTGLAEQAASQAFGQPVRPYYRFDQAAVILSLDCDFLGAEEDNYRHIGGFAKGRRIEKPTDNMNRLYVIEPLMTVTGMNADHRLRAPGASVAEKAAQLAQAILNNGQVNDPWLAACAQDLIQNRGKVLVVAGHKQPLHVHLLALAINSALDAVGQTLLLFPGRNRKDGTLAELAQALNQNQVDTLVITGGNPVYSAPADLNWAATQRKAREIIRLGYFEDETSKVVDWHLPEAHYLESWGDGRSSDGTYVPVQPLIEPLFGGLTELEVLARVAGIPPYRPHDIVVATFRTLLPNAKENDWKQFLHDGYLKNSAPQPVPAQLNKAVLDQALNAAAAKGAAPSKDSLEIAFHRDYSVDDGRYNNNGWLQEMPDPITKITWENVILVSQKTALELGFKTEDFFYQTSLAKESLLKNTSPRGVPRAKLSLGGKEIVGPVWLQPGMADNVVAIALGYGREQTGRIGFGSGFNAYAIRTSQAPYYAQGAKLVRVEGNHPISCTQHHWVMEGRPVVREANLEQYRQHPKFAKALDLEEPPVVASIYPNPLDKEEKNDKIVHQWGMSIDLNRCVGCQACVLACQSENNIPIVGKEQVYRQREMHWLRIDRYYTGPVSDPQVAYQPMLCQHCEAAPCENVCPVNATVHDEEGLNLMVYNRCVGTRYCSNNCPYKVRRFNFFDYHRRTIEQMKGPFYPTPFFKTTNGEHDLKAWVKNPSRHWRDEEEWELLKLVKNPDVSVRMRGVMEKCTFCVQRIESAKIRQKVKAGATNEVQVPDGTIQTACSQSCPADAIVFGNIKDSNSQVSKEKALDRTYVVLDYLYTRPRLSYLAKVRNPNPKMPGNPEHPYSTQEYAEAMGVHGNPYAHAKAGHGNASEHHSQDQTHGHGQEKKGAH